MYNLCGKKSIDSRVPNKFLAASSRVGSSKLKIIIKAQKTKAQKHTYQSHTYQHTGYSHLNDENRSKWPKMVTV